MASDKVRGEALTDGARRRFAVAVAGFALLYAVCVSFFYSSWLADQSASAIASFDNVLNPSIFLASIAFSLVVGCRLPVSRTLLAGFGYIAFAFAVGYLALTGGGADGVLVSTAAAAAGVGMGFVVPFYFEALAAYDSRRIALGCGIMSLGGMVLSMALDALPDVAGFVLYAACLAGSAGCLAFAWRTIADKQSRKQGASLRADEKGRALSRRDFLDVFLVSGVCTFALSIVYGILDTTATGGSATPGMSIAISQFGGVAAAVAFMLYFGLRVNPSPSMLFNVVFGVLATGILFLPFLSNSYAVSLNIVAAAGWKLVMLSLFYLVIVTYTRSRTRLLVGISLAYALPRLGLFIGQNIALLLDVGTADFVRTTAVAFFLLYLMLMVVWLVNARERKRAELRARAADELLGRFAQEQESVRKLRSDKLADSHGLTNREKDILYLLAQGRDLGFICEALFLSKNTVKSYQKTIYTKLGVHSKQEIIDLTQP